VIYHVEQGDARESLRKMPEASVHCCVTSPPYYALRSYLPQDHPDKALEIGSEKSIDEFVGVMVNVFREVKRVLHPSGTCWVNLGDSYSAAGNDGGHSGNKNAHSAAGINKHRRQTDIPAGNLCGVPWRVALALQADGWVLRQCLVWVKGVSGAVRFGSVMPESVSGTAWRRCKVKVAAGSIAKRVSANGEVLERMAVSEKNGHSLATWLACTGCAKCSATNGWVLRKGAGRCTSAYEFVFMFSKGKGYFWDDEAIKESQCESTFDRFASGVARQTNMKGGARGEVRSNDSFHTQQALIGGANPRSCLYWPTEPFPGAHFATYPIALPAFCIRAGTSEEGVCPKCLYPYARMVETKPMVIARSDRRSFLGDGVPGARTAASGTMVSAAESKTVGWLATCNCQAGEPIPATVLDPFAGSGTTGVAAMELGRNFIGCELSQAYIDEHINPRLKAVKQRYALLTPGA
jgi:DNA modification methylase